MATRIGVNRIEQFFAQIAAFEFLEPSYLRLLANLAVVRDLAAGQILWLQGQKVTHFTIVFSGQLRSMRRSPSGSEKLVSVLPPGYHFGLAEMITGASSSVTLVANEASTILAIDHRALRKKLLSNADICYKFMQTMARAIFNLTSELGRASFENVPTRLARLLLKNYCSQNRSAKSTRTTKNISHEELALQLGVSRETVSRTLANFKRKGLIKTSYRKITVLDRAGLIKQLENYRQS